MPQVANVTLRSTFSFNKTKENESTEIIFSFRERMSFNQCRCVGDEHQVNWVKLFFMMFPFTCRYFPSRMNFCNKSQTPNKIPLIILSSDLSRNHAHYEHFSSLSYCVECLILLLKQNDFRRRNQGCKNEQFFLYEILMSLTVQFVRWPKSVTAISILLTAISVCSRQFQFAQSQF